MACLCALPAVAQNDSLRLEKPFWTVNKATSVGYGSASIYDDYLSPLQYTGKSYLLQHERVSRTHFFKGKLVKQQFFSVLFADVDNPVKNSTEYAFQAEYRLGAHYPVWQQGNFRLMLGGAWEIAGGSIYNQRNSNNPAAVIAKTNLNASGQLFFRLKNVLFRWQADVPLAGAFFAPDHHESYYEISLGNHKNLVNFASFHNQRAFRSLLTVDFPVSNLTIRFGMQNWISQINNRGLVSHFYSNMLTIGLVSESFSLGGKKIKKTKAIRSPFYY